MYQVLARKWRPQRLDDLVGQQHVTRTLRNAVEAGRLAHAFVFAGIRGTGKTTVARILAKCLNCERGPTASPCNECASCREITEGRSIDVLELDAASRTGVNDIRELQEVVSFAPVRDRYKVLILDEAHMLSKSAVNALLKTIEEPPPRVVFVLATTEIHRILPTILSRCQVFEFRRISPREVSGLLRKVCDAEGIRVSDATIERIARAGEGSVRDSLSILERVLAFCGDEIGDEDARLVLGGVRTEALADLTRSMADRDAAGMLRVLDGVVEEGHDLVHFWNETVSVLRDLLLARVLPGREDLLTRSAEEAASLEQASRGLSREDLTRAFQIVADLEPALRSSSQPRFLFEAVLVRLASLGAVRPIEEMLADLEAGGTRDPESTRSSPTPAAASEKKKADPLSAPGPAGSDASRFLEAVRRDRPMLGAALDQAAAVEVASGSIRISFPAAREVMRRVTEREENLSFLRSCAEAVLGAGFDVRVGSSDAVGAESRGAPAPPRPSSPSTPSGDESPPSPSRPPAGADRQDLLDRARSEPGVRKLLSEFGARVVEIRPLEETPSTLAPPDSVATEDPA